MTGSKNFAGLTDSRKVCLTACFLQCAWRLRCECKQAEEFQDFTTCDLLDRLEVNRWGPYYIENMAFFSKLCRFCRNRVTITSTAKQISSICSTIFLFRLGFVTCWGFVLGFSAANCLKLKDSFSNYFFGKSEIKISKHILKEFW